MHSLIRPLVHIFANLFDGLCRVAKCDVNMSTEGLGKKFAVWYHPTVVNVVFTSAALDLAIESTLSKSSPPVWRVPILSDLSLIYEWPWILLYALSILHARGIWIAHPTRTMDHLALDDFKENWIFIWVWQSSTNKFINLPWVEFFSVNQRRMWAWGSSWFCHSMVYMPHHTVPKILHFWITSINLITSAGRL